MGLIRAKVVGARSWTRAYLVVSTLDSRVERRVGEGWFGGMRRMLLIDESKSATVFC